MNLWKDDNGSISLNEEYEESVQIWSNLYTKVIGPGRLTSKISGENFLNLLLYVLNV